MNIFKKKFHIVLCFVAFFITSCAPVKDIESKRYLFDVPQVKKNANIKRVKTLEVVNVSAVAPFGQVNFLYRINSGQFLTDYYNGFLASPDVQIEHLFRQYAQASGNFNLDTTVFSKAQNELRLQIVELYADYRDRTKPAGVISLHFVLTSGQKVLLDETLRESVLLQNKNTESLLRAWNQGLQQVLIRGILMLNKI